MIEKRFKPIKKISLEEAAGYISADEDFNNNFICFYTTEPSNDPDHHFNDGWETITYYTARSKKPIPGEGEGKDIIYIMSNPTIPGLLKIGFTSKPVEDRCKELSRATGVPVSFKIEYIFRVHGRGEEMEREIHRYLEHKRNSSRREFFDVTLDEAIDAIKKIGEKYI
jgi:hypothetical protein